MQIYGAFYLHSFLRFGTLPHNFQLPRPPLNLISVPSTLLCSLWDALTPWFRMCLQVENWSNTSFCLILVVVYIAFRSTSTIILTLQYSAFTSFKRSFVLNHPVQRKYTLLGPRRRSHCCSELRIRFAIQFALSRIFVFIDFSRGA